MTVLLLNCLNSWCQSDSIHLLRGVDTLVNIELSYIRQANIKLIEHKYCDKIISAKDSIISLHELKYSIADSIYKSEYRNCYNNVKQLETQIYKERNKSIRRKYIAGGAVISAIGFLVALILK